MEHTRLENKCEYRWAYMDWVHPNRFTSIPGLCISGSTIAGCSLSFVVFTQHILTRWNTCHTCTMLTLSTGSNFSSNIFLYFKKNCIYKSCVSLMLTAAWRSQESRADGFLWSLPRGIKTVEGLILLFRPAIWGAHFLSSNSNHFLAHGSQNEACECLTSFR